MMQEREQKAIQLSVAQVLAASLASVSAAVIASTFGLSGTLLGAAVTSVVATVGGALYTRSIEQARSRIRLRRNPLTGVVERDVLPPSTPRAFSWRLVLGAAALVFALALGTITAVEVAAHQPLARLVGHTAPVQTETTVGTLLQEVAEPEPAVSPLAQPTAAITPEITPTVVVPAAAPARIATPEVLATPLPTASAPRSQPALARETPTSTATGVRPVKPTTSPEATSTVPPAPTLRAPSATTSPTPQLRNPVDQARTEMGHRLAPEQNGQDSASQVE
jgi:hypothetical protein